MGNCCPTDSDKENEVDRTESLNNDDVDGENEDEISSDESSGKKEKDKKKKKPEKGKDGKKKEEVVKLEIKETKVATVDQSFKDAADPFNETVDTKTAFQKAIADFKGLANHENTDTLKDAMLDLKKKLPHLKLQFQKNPIKLILTTGESEDKGQDVVDLAKKLVDFVKDINDMSKRVLELLPKAEKDAEDLVKKSSDLVDSVKNANLKFCEGLRAVKNAYHNVKEFKKVPNICKNIYKAIDDFFSEFKEAVEAVEAADAKTGRIETQDEDSATENTPLLSETSEADSDKENEVDSETETKNHDVDGENEAEISSDESSGKKEKDKKKKKPEKGKDGKKKEEVVKLEIKETKVATVDQSFKDAADPFNETVDTKTAFQKAIADFKGLANHEKTDTLKDAMLDLKKKFPHLKLQFQKNPIKLILTTGESEDKGQDVVDLAKKLVDFVKDINDMSKKVLELLPKAKNDAEDLVKKSSDLVDSVKNAKLKFYEVPGAVKNAYHNVKEFKKVPNICKNIYKAIDDFFSEFKEAVEAVEAVDAKTGRVETQDEDSATEKTGTNENRDEESATEKTGRNENKDDDSATANTGTDENQGEDHHSATEKTLLLPK
ncbi:uncharacterized protein LOC144450718 [Glandiceps talaboti]